MNNNNDNQDGIIYKKITDGKPVLYLSPKNDFNVKNWWRKDIRRGLQIKEDLIIKS